MQYSVIRAAHPDGKTFANQPHDVFNRLRLGAHARLALIV